MLPFILYIIRFFIALQWPADQSKQSDWNAAILELIEQNDCKTAIERFKSDSTIRIFPETRLKISHCLLEENENELFEQQITRLKRFQNPQIVSLAMNQESLYLAKEGDTLKAINMLKRAIEIENNNTFAKHNFEFLSKVYKNSQSSPPPSGSSPQNRPENSGGTIDNQNQGDDELQNSNPPEIDLAQAMQLLDAMRAGEFENILQLKAAKTDSVDYGKW
ncbi:hypothetical protein [Jiulongibacter sediminis]|uniref:hypothetical protein n=1 Tax=Jiulongibacter sediminis TaxID=1605367 RepID=UPI0026F2CD6D|nr:hypothetical protein [Jiulongibacter sediminis]